HPRRDQSVSRACLTIRDGAGNLPAMSDAVVRGGEEPRAAAEIPFLVVVTATFANAVEALASGLLGPRFYPSQASRWQSCRRARRSFACPRASVRVRRVLPRGQITCFRSL